MSGKKRRAKPSTSLSKDSRSQVRDGYPQKPGPILKKRKSSRVTETRKLLTQIGSRDQEELVPPQRRLQSTNSSTNGLDENEEPEDDEDDEIDNFSPRRLYRRSSSTAVDTDYDYGRGDDDDDDISQGARNDEDEDDTGPDVDRRPIPSFKTKTNVITDDNPNDYRDTVTPPRQDTESE